MGTSSPRVVSLIASATEIICALGAREQLVGISHECDYPSDVKSLPVCSHAKLRTDVSSIEIDRQVKSLLADAISIYGLENATIDGLEPTHLVTQSQCDVCAVSLSDVQQAVCETLISAPQIVVCEPNNLADVWADIRRVATAINRQAEGEALLDRLHERLDSLQNRQRESRKPRVACIEWTEPMMAAGNWVPELVEIAGGESVIGTAGEHSPWLTEDELKHAEPDVIVILPCGFDLARTLKESQDLTRLPVWSTLPAVQNDRVFAVDGNAYFNRPGPRLVDSAELLAELFYDVGPEDQGDGVRWQRLRS